MRIAFIHNKFIDYRIPFFKSLSKRYDVTFFFEDKITSKNNTINAVFSNTLNPPIRNIRISPLLPFKLLCGDFDLFISGDLGYSNTMISLFVAKLIGKPFIIWSEEWHPKNILREKRFSMKNRIVNHSDACIGAGQKSASFFKYLGAKDEKIFIAPNASIPNINSPQRPSCISSNNRFERDLIKVLFLGRIVPSKGIDYLIRAFRVIESKGLSAILTIAGNGPFLNELEDLARRENVKNIIFTRHFASASDKIYLYQNCDIFVLPSVYYGYVEAWGLVLNEVMYFGKPVIATEMVGAAYDLIENKMNGYMVPEKNVEALSEALMKIIKDAQLRKSMGQMSKRIIEEGYKVSDMVNGFGDAIDFVCSDFKSNK